MGRVPPGLLQCLICAAGSESPIKVDLIFQSTLVEAHVWQKGPGKQGLSARALPATSPIDIDTTQMEPAGPKQASAKKEGRTP